MVDAMTARIAALSGGDLQRQRSLTQLAASADPDFVWRQLRGHRVVSGVWLSDESLRVQYVHLTDVLIGRVIDEKYDTLLFLDKSGRPVAWLLGALWDVLAPAFEDDRPAAWPLRAKIHFLNVDRLQWRDVLDPLGTGTIDAGGIPVGLIDDLRRTLLVHPRDQALAGRDLYDAVTFFSGRSVLVVDEVKVGGSTVEIACGLLERAFPDARFAGTQWMQPGLVLGKDGNKRNNQLPVWYRNDTALGRGIGDRDPDDALRSPLWRARVGRYFLSRPHGAGVDDRSGRQLREELRQLAALALRSDLTVIPSFDRPDAEQRALFFSGMSLRELVAWREANEVHLHPA